MSSMFVEPSRKNVRIKMALAGRSGTGKTYSSLTVAKGLVKDMKKVAFLQTEPGRAECYLKSFEGFKILNLDPPFTPERHIAAIEDAEKAGFAVLIIDSISDEWRGSGGIYSEYDKMRAVAKHPGTVWAKLTPRHDALFNKILNSKMHIISTIKKHESLDVKTNALVLKDMVRPNTEYQWHIQFDLDNKNLSTVVKDNTSLFQGTKPFKITEDVGSAIRDWCLN